MRTLRVTASVLTLILLPTLGMASPASAGAELSIEFESIPAGPGAVSPETDELAQKLTELVETSPQTLTGVRIGSDNKVVLAVASEADAAVARATTRRLAATTPVRVQAVGRSRAELKTIRANIEGLWNTGAFGDVVTGIGTDSSRGVTIVYAKEASAAVRTSIKERFGDAVVFRRGQVYRAAAADRSRDTAPHTGGSGIYLWNAEHTGRRGWCSTAFPITINGTTHMLTAAHCAPGGTVHTRAWASAFTTATPVPSNSYNFGRMTTSTLAGTYDNINEGNQDRYGDWALLSGSTYRPYIYNCGNRTGACSTLKIGSANYGNPVLGAGVCTSGWTTTQVCRQHVTDEDLTTEIDYEGGSLRVNNLAATAPAETCSDNPAGGDSGGAVYQSISSRPGYVRAMGIITAVSTCTGLFTKLAGVRAWGPSATVPLL